MPDEKDRPRDPSDFSSLLEDLQEQLRLAIDKSNNPPAPEEWTSEEQSRLNAELARIPFDPRHADPDYSDKIVIIDDEEVPVHFTNNFSMILTLIDDLRHHGDGPRGPFEEAYASVAAERRYNEVFEKLEAVYPTVHKRTKQIFISRQHPGSPGLGLTPDEQAYIQSQAFSAAAHIARQLDPVYDLGRLRK